MCKLILVETSGHIFFMVTSCHLKKRRSIHQGHTIACDIVKADGFNLFKSQAFFSRLSHLFVILENAQNLKM